MLSCGVVAPVFHEPRPAGAGKHVGIVAARYNGFISAKLVEGAVEALVRNGVRDDDIEVAWVPGSFEVPAAARRMVTTGRFHALVCLGTLIRGETAHFDVIAAACARGIEAVSRETGVPCGFGVLTCDTAEQAVARAAPGNNKGAEAAEAALEMVDLFRRLDGSRRGGDGERARARRSDGG